MNTLEKKITVEMNFSLLPLFDRHLSPWIEDTQHLRSEGSHIRESRALLPSAGAVKARCSLSHSLASCMFGDDPAQPTSSFHEDLDSSSMKQKHRGQSEMQGPAAQCEGLGRRPPCPQPPGWHLPAFLHLYTLQALVVLPMCFFPLKFTPGGFQYLQSRSQPKHIYRRKVFNA